MEAKKEPIIESEWAEVGDDDEDDYFDEEPTSADTVVATKSSSPETRVPVPVPAEVNANDGASKEESETSSPPPKREEDGEVRYRRGQRGRSTRGRRGGRGQRRPIKNLREMIPADPTDIKNSAPSISIDMLKMANPPFVVKFINCPPDLDSEILAELFGIKAENVANMEPVELSNGVCYTCVTLSTREVALSMFDRYVKDNKINGQEFMLLYKPVSKTAQKKQWAGKEEQKKSPKKHVENVAPVTNTIDEEPAEKKFKGRGTQSHYESEENTLQSDKAVYKNPSEEFRPRMRRRAGADRRSAGAYREPRRGGARGVKVDGEGRAEEAFDNHREQEPEDGSGIPVERGQWKRGEGERASRRVWRAKKTQQE